MFIATLLPMRACIPTNNSLTGPLQPFIRFVEGGIGGLLFALIVLLLIIALLSALFKAARGMRIADALAVMISIPLVFIGGIIIIALFVSIVHKFNGMC
jgi:hypothetical protein